MNNTFQDQLLNQEAEKCEPTEAPKAQRSHCGLIIATEQSENFNYRSRQEGVLSCICGGDSAPTY